MIQKLDHTPTLVLSAHGINTHAKWQKTFSEIMSDHSLKTRNFDYGKYSVLKYLCLDKAPMVDAFHRFYQEAVASAQPAINLDNHLSRPSIIAHSFGSYLVGNALLKYEEIKFDKVILCGSVLPRDFDWWQILSRDQVHLVKNEYGAKDIWAGLTGLVVAQTGPSGREGFILNHHSLEQHCYTHFEHSDYFEKDHISQSWVSFVGLRISRLTTRHGQSISKKSFNKYFRESLKIDKASFDGILNHQAVEPTMDHAQRWIEINPDIYTFLVDRYTDLPVGYLNAIPASEKLVEKIKAGRLRDNEICQDDILPYTSDQVVTIYCLSIAIAPKHQVGLIGEGLEKLLNSFCAKLLKLAQDNRIFVSDIYADAWTAKGKRICAMIGMKESHKDEFGNVIYHLDLKNLSGKSHYRSLHDLAAYYRGHVNWF